MAPEADQTTDDTQQQDLNQKAPADDGGPAETSAKPVVNPGAGKVGGAIGSAIGGTNGYGTQETRERSPEEIQQRRISRCIGITQSVVQLEQLFDRYQRMAFAAANAAQRANPELAKRIHVDVETVRKRLTADKEETLKAFDEALTAP